MRRAEKWWEAYENPTQIQVSGGIGSSVQCLVGVEGSPRGRACYLPLLRVRLPVFFALALVACSVPSTTEGNGPAGPPYLIGAEPHLVTAGVPFDLRLVGANLTNPGTVSVTRETDLFGNSVQGPTISATSLPVHVPQQEGGHATVRLTLPETGVYSLLLVGALPLSHWFVVYPPSYVQPPKTNVFCFSGPQSFTFQGSFASVPVTLPIGRIIPPNGNAFQFVDLELGGCTPIAFPRHPAALCTSATYPFNGNPFNPHQHWTLWMQPGPGSPWSLDILVEKTSGPSQLGEFVVGDAAVPFALSFVDNPFVVMADAGPSVTLDGAPVQATRAQSLDSSLPGQQLCDQITAMVPAGTKPGQHMLVFTGISGCASSFGIVVYPPPQIIAIGPTPISKSSNSGLAQITGVGFHNTWLLVDGRVIDYEPRSCGGETCIWLDLYHGGINPGSHVAVVGGHYLQAGVFKSAVSPPFTFDVNP